MVRALLPVASGTPHVGAYRAYSIGHHGRSSSILFFLAERPYMPLVFSQLSFHRDDNDNTNN